jgi:hypothetical protein
LALLTLEQRAKFDEDEALIRRDKTLYEQRFAQQKRGSGTWWKRLRYAW